MLVDDHRIIREGLRSMIEKEPAMEVAGEAENGRSAIYLAKETRPDVIVMDLTMPDLNGIEAIRQVLADCPGIKVLALSMHSDKRFVDGALEAGASGYLLKDCAFEELARAIKALMANQTYLSSGIAGTVVKEYVQHLVETSVSPLTSREREVLQLVAEGKCVKDIASTLSLSVKTVESHRHRIMHKLQIFDVPGLTKYAIREGLISLDG